MESPSLFSFSSLEEYSKAQWEYRKQTILNMERYYSDNGDLFGVDSDFRPEYIYFHQIEEDGRDALASRDERDSWKRRAEAVNIRRFVTCHVPEIVLDATNRVSYLVGIYYTYKHDIKEAISLFDYGRNFKPNLSKGVYYKYHEYRRITRLAIHYDLETILDAMGIESRQNPDMEDGFFLCEIELTRRDQMEQLFSLEKLASAINRSMRKLAPYIKMQNNYSLCEGCYCTSSEPSFTRAVEGKWFCDFCYKKHAEKLHEERLRVEALQKAKDEEDRLLLEAKLDKKKHMQVERRKMSPKLRYQVFERDNFRCVACGRSASDGITLCADHIKPIALGGFTVLDNLQTLCDYCNSGKSDRSSRRIKA